MRARLVLGGLAAALALGAVPAASAAPGPTCAEGFDLLCVVLCRLSKPPC